MINTDQACCGSKRFIVVEKIADLFLAEMLRLMSEYTPEDPMNVATTRGPVSSRLTPDHRIDQRNIVVSHDAKIWIVGDRVPATRAFFVPTVITDIKSSNSAFKQELFGSVATSFSAKTKKDTIAHDSFLGRSSIL